MEEDLRRPLGEAGEQIEVAGAQSVVPVDLGGRLLVRGHRGGKRHLQRVGSRDGTGMELSEGDRRIGSEEQIERARQSAAQPPLRAQPQGRPQRRVAVQPVDAAGVEVHPDRGEPEREQALVLGGDLLGDQGVRGAGLGVGRVDGQQAVRVGQILRGRGRFNNRPRCGGASRPTRARQGRPAFAAPLGGESDMESARPSGGLAQRGRGLGEVRRHGQRRRRAHASAPQQTGHERRRVRVVSEVVGRQDQPPSGSHQSSPPKGRGTPSSMPFRPSGPSGSPGISMKREITAPMVRSAKG